MRFPTLRRKRVWIPALVVSALGIGGWVWADRSPRYIDPRELAYEPGVPSSASLRAAPYYGTKVRFLASADEACAQAAREDKLVLVLHLSGRFGSSETT